MPIAPASRHLGITLGDVTGIGPEVALKALHIAREKDGTRYVLVGDFGIIQKTCLTLGLEIPRRIGSIGGQGDEKLAVWTPPGEPLPRSLSPGCPEAAHAAVRWLKATAESCLAGQLDGIVTAPVSKEAILCAGIPFVGQTEYLTAVAGEPATGMMLLGPDDRGRWLRVLLATTHLPLKDVAARLSRPGIVQSIRLAHQACGRLGLSRSRIAVCGLNPHAGEGGKMGREEIETIGPAVEDARRGGIDVEGPYSADTLFHRVYRGDYDVVVAMYHDQGLVPLKMVAFDSGVNWTVGLPFIRTSPDHGTAYDIAGRGIANPSSMVAAIEMAAQLVGKGPVVNREIEK